MPLRRLLPLLALLLALNTAALVAGLAISAWRSDTRAAASLAAVDRFRLALVAVEMVSRERGPANAVLGDAAPSTTAHLEALRTARARTDASWDALVAALPGLNPQDSRHAALQDLAADRQALALARAAVDRVRAEPIGQRTPAAIHGAVDDMVALVPRLAPTIRALARDAQQDMPGIGDDLQGARLTAELREYCGLLGSQFTAALARRTPFTTQERLAIERTRGRIDELRFLVELRVRAPSQAPDTLQAWNAVQTRYFDVATRLVDSVIATGERDGAFELDAAAFAARYVPDMNRMFVLRDVLLEHAAARARAERARDARQLRQAIAVSLLMAGILAATLVVVHRRVLRPLDAITKALHAMARNDLDAPLVRPVADDEIAAVVGAVHTLRARTLQRERLERERDELIAQLREQSNSDFLTGLPNRRAFFARATQMLALARQQQDGVAVVMFDIDDFKAFNDRLGHAAGDRALIEVARVVQRELRPGDLVGRHGGEEFALMLPRCDGAHALQFAEKLRAAIAAAPVTCPDGHVIRVTASFGVAGSVAGEAGLEALLARADAAMYLAKKNGRNRAELAADTAPDAGRPASRHLAAS